MSDVYKILLLDFYESNERWVIIGVDLETFALHEYSCDMIMAMVKEEKDIQVYTARFNYRLSDWIESIPLPTSAGFALSEGSVITGLGISRILERERIKISGADIMAIRSVNSSVSDIFTFNKDGLGFVLVTEEDKHHILVNGKRLMLEKIILFLSLNFVYKLNDAEIVLCFDSSGVGGVALVYNVKTNSLYYASDSHLPTDYQKEFLAKSICRDEAIHEIEPVNVSKFLLMNGLSN